MGIVRGGTGEMREGKAERKGREKEGRGACPTNKNCSRAPIKFRKRDMNRDNSISGHFCFP